jgi:hypothetical protein
MSNRYDLGFDPPLSDCYQFRLSYRPVPICENDLVAWMPAKRPGQMAGFSGVENHGAAGLEIPG